MPGLERRVSDSSGFTVPAARFIHTLRGSRPRARMSSENEVSFAKFFSTRLLTKVPEPCLRISRPSSTSSSMALRTVMRETSSISARSRSGGSASSGRDDAVFDGAAQRALQLLIERLRARVIERRQYLRKSWQGDFPLKCANHAIGILPMQYHLVPCAIGVSI